MADGIAKPLQAMFDVEDWDSETVEGIGFEPGVRYQFAIEKNPQGKYMQYGAAKGGLFVLSKKCPDDLKTQYQKHPDQFEIFTAGEINGMQALVPGRDFEKFKPYLNKTIDVAWVHSTDSGQKRLVFMSLNASDKEAVNPGHPEWESRNVRLARKMGVDVPAPGSKDRFNLSFLHPGVAITAEVVMVKPKGADRERPAIDIETIEPAEASGKEEPQKKLVEDGIDPEIRMTILELAEGEKSVVGVIKKVKAHLKASGETDAKVLGDYSAAISKMKDRKEILA
jgi:hypothetical protein